MLKQYNRRLEEDLIRKVKLYCVTNEISEDEFIEQAVRMLLDPPAPTKPVKKPEALTKEELRELGASSWAGMKHPSDEVDEAIERYWQIKRSPAEEELLAELYPRQTKK